MKIFVSWSTEEAKIVAGALREYIPKIFNAKVFYSPDVSGGDQWLQTLLKELDRSQFGILCLTRDNLNSNWIHFEAGAIARSFKNKNHVVPFLIDIGERELRSSGSPLVHFQPLAADKIGTRKLFEVINKAMTRRKHTEQALNDLFEMYWSDINSALLRVRNPPMFRMTDDNGIKNSERKAGRVQAFNFSLEPEVGLFNPELGRSREIGYLMEAVIGNLQEGREYEYILARKPWCTYDKWVDQVIEQATSFSKILARRNMADCAKQVTMSFLYVPSLLAHSIDIHTLADSSDNTVGFWCLETPGISRHAYVVEVRDSNMLKSQWALLDEVASKHGIRMTLQSAVENSESLKSMLIENGRHDVDMFYGEGVERINGEIWNNRPDSPSLG